MDSLVEKIMKIVLLISGDLAKRGNVSENCGQSSSGVGDLGIFIKE
jgi:hypothetical protein